MQDKLFGQKTYNQIKTDLIHIQNDLMTSQEQHQKIAHVVDFVKDFIPELTKVSTPEESLVHLNKYFNITANPLVAPEKRNKKTNTVAFMSALRNGRLPSEDIITHAQGGKVFIIEEDGEPYPVDRESVSDYLGDILQSNINNSEWVKDFLLNHKFIDLMHKKGLIEQINHAFRNDKKKFLEVFEDISANDPYANTAFSEEILKFLFRRELTADAASLFTFLKGLKSSKFNKTVNILLPLARKKHKNLSVKFWDQIKPDSQVRYHESDDHLVGTQQEEVLVEEKPTKTKSQKSKKLSLDVLAKQFHSIAKTKSTSEAKDFWFKATKGLTQNEKSDLVEKIKSLQVK